MKKVPRNILIAIFSVLIVVLVLFSFSLSGHPLSYLQQGSNYLATIDKNILPGQQEQPTPGIPLHLTIPSIHVDANVIQVGLTKGGSVDTPKGPYEVGWFNRGPMPGQQGSSVLVGHYGTWANGAHSVFDNLNSLKKGDIVQVKDDKGTVSTFVVRETRIYNPDDIVPEIFNKNDGTYLNLITCNGNWISTQKTYNKRLVVFTVKQ